MEPEQLATVPMRPATLDDVAAIEQLIEASARGLCATEYSAAEIEAALGSAWGCDSELIRDGTYFVVEVDRLLVACGGWGRRRTLFGGDRRAERQPELLDPACDAARIRAFFVHPDFARRGLGRAVLARCEAEAVANGFRAAELMATLTGIPLYRACGYAEVETVQHPAGAQTIQFVRMRKPLG